MPLNGTPVIRLALMGLMLLLPVVPWFNTLRASTRKSKDWCSNVLKERCTVKSVLTKWSVVRALRDMVFCVVP